MSYRICLDRPESHCNFPLPQCLSWTEGSRACHHQSGCIPKAEAPHPWPEECTNPSGDAKALLGMAGTEPAEPIQTEQGVKEHCFLWQDAVHVSSSVESMAMQEKGTKDQQCLGIPGFDLCPEDSAPQRHRVSELWQPCAEDTRQKGCQEIQT